MIKKIILLSFIFVFTSSFVISNNIPTPPDWGGITTSVSPVKTNLIAIIGHIIGIIMGVGFVITLWKVASGKQDSKEQLVALGGGLLIYILAYSFGFLTR